MKKSVMVLMFLFCLPAFANEAGFFKDQIASSSEKMLAQIDEALTKVGDSKIPLSDRNFECKFAYENSRIWLTLQNLHYRRDERHKLAQVRNRFIELRGKITKACEDVEEQMDEKAATKDCSPEVSDTSETTKDPVYDFTFDLGKPASRSSIQ